MNALPHHHSIAPHGIREYQRIQHQADTREALSTWAIDRRAKEIDAASADAKSYIEKLKAAFPDLQQAGFVDLSASYLYAAPH